MPGVRYSDAYSRGNEASGVTTVNAGDAMKGTTIDRVAASVRRTCHANVA